MLAVNAIDIVHPEKDVGRQPPFPDRRCKVGIVSDIQQCAASLHTTVNRRIAPDPLLLESERLFEVADGSSHIGRRDHGNRGAVIRKSHGCDYIATSSLYSDLRAATN